MWFFLGIEELPLAAEEAHDPAKDIPRAGIVGLVTLCLTGALVFVLNPAVTGSAALAESGEPLLDGFRVFMSDDWAAVLSLFALVGLLASLQGIMFAYGRNMFSLSRAGLLPEVPVADRGAADALDRPGCRGRHRLHRDRRWSTRSAATAGDIILNIAVWGAVIAYLLQMVSYVLLRRKFPTRCGPT